MRDLRRIVKMAVVLCLAGSVAGSCAVPPRQSPDPEYWPSQAWQSATPEAQGMDSAVLARMFENVRNDDIRLHSLLIVRNGYLVVEAYWPPYGPDDSHAIESITKSIVGTLIGIAIDRGSLHGADLRLVDLFPQRSIQNLDGRKESITLRHLLSMTPGLACQDQSPAGQGVRQAEDWSQYLLDLPVTDTPGSRWIYCSGAAHLLSAILQGATGMTARTYANTFLFEPLGIPEVPEQGWRSDPSGVTVGMTGLYLRPRDLAKYGYLYLKKGRWNGRQVLPAQWVEESTREQAYIGPDDYVDGLDRRFGYMWSIFPERRYYGFLGMAGQELFVSPEKNVVIVFSGGLQVGKEAVLLRLVNEYILPAVVSEDSLPPNPQAFSRLEALIRAAEESRLPVPALPQMALDVSGKTYILDPNSLGWKDMTFTFQPESATAVLRLSPSPDLEIGLDNRYRLTEMPEGRPVGLRGRWLAPDEFELDYIIRGDFIESVGRFKFEGRQTALTITNLNYGGPPMTLHGSAGQ
jgi:CubicO group peptidase (beta-lactamase class C family)